jgi:hypothetical protein
LQPTAALNNDNGCRTAVATLDLFSSWLFRLRRELARLLSRLATTRHLARLRRQEEETAHRRGQALVEEARRMTEVPRKQG